MRNTKKVVSALLAAAVLAGCASGSSAASGSAASSAGSSEEPLVVGYSPFNSKFSPFFSETAYDQDVWAMTQISLLSSDRQGAIVYKGIEGETRAYNGTDYTYYGPADLVVTENADGSVYYDFTLKDGLTFSDGEKLTIDDVIFSMYVLADPTYDGSSTLYSVPIVGMDEYRSGVESLLNLLVAAGRDNTDFTYWTEDQQKTFWAAVDEAYKGLAQDIIDYLVAAGYNTAEDSVAKCAANWGFELAEDADLQAFADAIKEAYGDDPLTAIGTEGATLTAGDLIADYESYLVGVQTGESAANISGIQKTGENSLRVVTSEVDATAIYHLSVTIAPLHYYGDASAYDYDNNKFGFTKGDLSTVRAKTTQPLGAGPYVFQKFENGVVNFVANDSYYQGAPKTKYINFLQSNDADKLNGVVTGTVDITDPSFSQSNIDAIESANGGELTGSVITTNTVDNLGYGYIGIAADVVKVGDAKDSDESKALRKAFATVFSVYRDVAIDSYYGDRASVINYPISNTSWAAPQATDADYKLAFSVDVDGNDIYTSDMTTDAKYEAALAAAKGFFEKAGYTFADGTDGNLVATAPEGAATSYEFYIPADGTGDHPAFMILTLSRDALAKLGIELVIRDLSNSSELWTGLEARTVPMWAAAWGASVDPDMYQIYYSDVANGGAQAGGSNYMYAIADAELDQWIMDARKSTDQAYRKAMYKTCLDRIIDWACEVPTYQRQNCIIFSTERVNIDSVTPDITTFYGWMSEVQNIELK